MKFDDAGIIEGFVNEVLPLDFLGLYGEEDFNGDLSSVFFIVGFEHVGVLSSTELLSDGIVLDVSG